MRVRAAGALALVVLLLTGCTAIPTSGGVQAGSTTQPNNPNPVFQPSVPLSNATKENIVQGFVYAQSALSDSVAKLYLTADFAKRWRPDRRVLVQSDSWAIRSSGSADVRLQVPVSATIDASGAYTPGAGSVPLTFSLEKVKGQWRISDGPDGVVLPQAVFQRNLVSQSIQYFDPTWSRLVPDLRFFPLRSSLDERIVDALLDPLPSSSPLRGVVASAFPSGTRLNSVSKNAGTTTITLAVPGATPSRSVTDRMQRQLAGSLGGISTTDLRLLVNGTLATPAAPVVAETLNNSPIVLANDRFGPLGPRGVSEDAGVGKRVVAADPTAITVYNSQRSAAVLTAKGVAAIDAQSTRIVDSRHGLVPPTVDQRGWIYSVPADDPQGLQVSTAKGKPIPVAADLGGTDVVAIEASYDGTRMLVVVRTATDGPLAYVAGIERASDGTPTGLTAAHYPIPFVADVVVGATWIDNGSVAVLTTGGSDQQTVLRQQLGGLSTDLGRLPSSATIVGTTDPSEPLRVLTADTDDLYVLRDDVWQANSPDPIAVSVLAVQR